MTQRSGLIQGLCAGFAVYIFYRGYIIFSPAATLVQIGAYSTAEVLFLVGIIICLAPIFRRRALISPTADYFIGGFVTAFAIADYAASALTTHTLPAP